MTLDTGADEHTVRTGCVSSPRAEADGCERQAPCSRIYSFSP